MIDIEKIKATALRAVKCDYAEAPVFSPETVLELISLLESADTCRETLVSTIQTNNSVIKSRDDKISDLLVKLEAAERTAQAEAFEAAAELCSNNFDMTGHYLAYRIREMAKEKQNATD